MADVGILLLFKSVLFCCHCRRMSIVNGIIIYFMSAFSAIIYLSFDFDIRRLFGK